MSQPIEDEVLFKVVVHAEGALSQGTSPDPVLPPIPRGES